MAITKEVIIDVKSGQAQKDVEKINNLFKEVDKSVDEAEKSTVSLRSELRKIQQDLASGKLTGEEFIKASQRAGELKDVISDVSQRINILSSDTQNLDLALSVGSGLAGGFSAAQGAMGLFGAESEEINQAILKVQSSLALLNGVQAIANTLNKDSALMVQLQTKGLLKLTGVQQVYTAIVGTSTGALKAFRIALISTGIGAIVVGLGLLISNFEKVSKWATDVTEKFGGWRKILMFVSPPIWLIIKALERLGIIDDEQTAKAKKNAQERIDAQKKESAELDRRKDKLEGYYDFEIRKAKAAGKNTLELEKQKRAAILQTLRAQNDLERSWIRTNAATEKDIKRWNERQKLIIKIQQDIKISEIENQKELEDEREKLREKQKSDAQKAAQERAAEKKALLDIETNFLKQIEDLEDKTEKQRMARAKARALQQIEEMKGTEADKEKARLQILEFYAQKEKELQKKTDDEKEKAKEDRLAKIEQIEAEFDLRRKELEAKTEAEKEAIEIEKLSIEREKKEAELIELGLDEEKRLEILESFAIQEDAIRQKYAEQEEARQEALRDQTIALVAGTFGQISNILGQNSKAGKAFAIAESLINTYQGITAALKLPFPANIPGVAYASATGFAAVKNIASTNVSNPSASGSFSSAAPASAPVQAPEFNILGQGGFNQLAETLGQQQQQPIQTYVVANDVTTMQSLDRNIVQNATL